MQSFCLSCYLENESWSQHWCEHVYMRLISDKLLTENLRQCDRKMVALPLAAVPDLTIGVNLQGNLQLVITLICFQTRQL